MQKITPFLWFNDNAEEAMNFYSTIFSNVKINEGARINGKLLTATFEINGQSFIALNGGPMYPFTEAISFVVSCDTQEEIDDKWNRLTADGGAPSRCGWLKDKFGLSWQIVPPILGQLMSSPDRVKAGNVMQAMMKMDKIIIQELKDAAEQA